MSDVAGYEYLSSTSTPNATWLLQIKGERSELCCSAKLRLVLWKTAEGEMVK